jgi:ribose transport system substrate-binding protein
MQALVYHPNVVIVDAVPPSQFETVFSAYAKAGVTLIPAFEVGTSPNPVIPTMDVGGESYYANEATMLADWLAVDSKGKGHVALVNYPGFAFGAVFENAFNAELDKACPDCKVTTVDENTAEALDNQGAAPVISTLRRDPSIKYVLSENVPFLTGFTAALDAAGLYDVKWGGGSGDITDLQEIAAGGQEVVTTGCGEIIAGWLSVDAALRHLEGSAYPSDYGHLPTQILTAGNKDRWTISPSFDEPANYQDLFKAAWKVS